MAPSTEFLVAVAKQKLLKTNEKGTFANDSFLTRLPHLVLDVATNNRPRLTEKQYLDLLNLAEDLKNDAQIPPLITPENKSTKDREDTKKWMHLLTIFEFSWQNAPWFYAEAYMFRLVLQLSGFYETGVDPFHYSKLAELNEKTPWKLLEEALVTAESSSDGVGAESSLTREEKLKILIKFSLWGNKADGCYKVVKDTVSGNGASLAVEDKYLLVDDTDKVLCYLKERGNDDITIQFINDNCGTELLLDLALADHLITHKWCKSVTLHVKGEPTYISDATEKDVYEHIQEMGRSSHPEIIRSLSKRLKFYLDQKKFQIRPDIFWNTYAFYWEFPSVIEDFIKTTALVIIKGDANYRRLLGDRLWPATTNVEQAISFFPTSFVSLRTLKSNPIVGLTAQMEKQLEQEDPHWRINGKRGIIQSVLKKEYINTKQE